MNSYEIIFTLTNKEKLIFKLDEPLNKVHCCYDVPIIFYHDNNQILLSTGSIHENIVTLHSLLTKALKNDLKLHKSITQDIGYLYNEELQGNPGLFYTKLEERDYWIGNNYLLWSHKFATWLYNDNDGNIILEITPIYPGIFIDPAETANGTTYEKWIEGYKPCFTQKIPLDIAENWLKQASSILKVIDENIKREFAIK